MQKIIFINRFFFPDHSATSQLLSDLTSKLILPDSEIHIITSRMNYDDETVVYQSYENINGIHVHRCWTSRFGRGGLIGRAVDYLTFYITSFFMLFKLTARNDIVVAKTDPPLISVTAAVVVKLKKAKLVNWVQDLFPEVAKELGIKLFSGVIFNIVKYFRNWSLRTAEYNIVLGEIMAERINAEINQPDKTVIIPNWVVGSEMTPVERKDNALRNDWGLNGKFVVGYSGNLGRAHDYKTILKAIVSLQDEEVCFVFIGGGAGYDILKNKVESQNLQYVYFKSYQPTEVLSQSLSVPDVHLISLEPSLEGLIVPSKFYGVISVGRPIVFLGDENGEISRLIKKHQCGRFLSMGDDEGLVLKIIELKKNKDTCDELSRNSRKLYEECFSIESSISSWQKTLESLCV